MLKTNQIQKVHKVLIVDDQELNRDILGAILEDSYALDYAENGREAMEYLKNNSIAIRYMGDYIRITSGTQEENFAVIKAIEKFISEN